MVSSILLQNFKGIALKLKKMNKGERFRCHIPYAHREGKKVRVSSMIVWERTIVKLSFSSHALDLE